MDPDDGVTYKIHGKNLEFHKKNKKKGISGIGVLLEWVVTTKMWGR